MSRLLAASLALVLTIAVAAPGIALSPATGETTATPEPAPVDTQAPEVEAPPVEPAAVPAEPVAAPLAVEALAAPVVPQAMTVLAGPNFARDFKQFANEVGSEQWIGGAIQQNKATYSEGMSVPQRLLLTNISTADTGHFVTFRHQFTKSGKYAYDFVTSWSQARSAASSVAGQSWSDSWQWMGLDAATVDLVDNYYVDVSVPSNGFSAAHENAYEGPMGFGDRTIRVYSDKPISNVHVTMDPTLYGSVASDSSLQFTVGWDGPADNVMILYASHIANGLDPYLPSSGIGWGANEGAGSISGAPYHNQLRASSEWTGTASEDNQLMASSVDIMSGIRGMKFNDLDGDGVYPPEAGESGLPGWQIWADLGGTVGAYDAGIDAMTTTNADGQYGLYFYLPSQSATSVKVYEVQQTDWTQTYPAAGYQVVDCAPGLESTGYDFGNYYNVPPQVRITKTANPTQVPETGGDVVFTFLIENIGAEDFTVTSLSDSKFGSLKDEAEAAWIADGHSLPISIPVGGAWSFDYDTRLAADDLVAHTNVVTVDVTDDDGDTDSATDDATVTFVDVPPVITVVKSASPTHIPEGGAYVTFTVTVTNPGPEDVTLTALTDSVFGDLNGQGTLSVPQFIAIGGSYTGTFTKALASDTLTPHTNTVTATAVDDDGTPATASDDATVTFDDALPVIEVTKTANHSSLPEPGGDVTFTVTVTNPASAPEAVWLSSLIDSVYGNLDGKGTIDVTPAVKLEPGASYSGSFAETISGNAGTVHTNVVTATAHDNDGNNATDSDDETVRITDVLPTLLVSKSASPTTLPEPGGNVTFTVTVTNPASAVEPVWLSSLVDDVYGNLDGKGTIDLSPAIELAPGASYTGSFTGAVAGNAGSVHVDTITGTAHDDDGNNATDTGTASVAITDVPPQIAVTKSASPTHVPETGGDVTFTIEVTNTGIEAVTLTDAVDTVFGPIELSAFDTTYLPVGATATAQFTKWLASDNLVAHHDVVTVKAEDNDGTSVSDHDDETVTFDDILPDISVVKNVDRTWMIMPGGTFHYTATVTNNAEEPVQVISVVDDIAGTIYLFAQGDAEIWLAPHASRDFTFSIAHTSPGVFANTVTATGQDNDGNTDSAEDDASVTITNPKIQVVKTSDAPADGVESGTLVTYTYVVTNIGDVDLFNIVLTDDKLGEIGTLDMLGVEESHTFTKSTTLVDGVTNVATVTAVDEHQNEVKDTDDETVDTFLRFTDLDLAILKSASRTHAEPGDLVTYTLTYWNNGTKPATNFTIVDDFDERYASIENASGGVISDGKITWTVPGPLVAADGNRTITYTVRISNNMPEGTTNVDNVVVIRHPDDSDDSNNTSRRRVIVDEPFLPFTGGEYLLILVVAMLAGVVGLTLRLKPRKNS